MNIGQIFKRAADLNEEVAFYNAFYDGFSETATLSEEEKKLLNANHTAFSLELRKRFNSTLWSYQCPSICLGPNDIDKLSQATKIKLEGDVAPDDQWRVIHHLVELTQMPQFQTLTIVCWDSEGDFVGAVFSDDEGETDSHCPSRFYLRASRFCRFPPKSKSLRASLRSCRLTQPWCRSQEEKLIEVKLRKRLSFLTDPLVEKFAGVSRVNAVLTRDMATLLAAKPALVSLALNAALSKPAEDKEQQADFKQGLPLNVVLPKASEDGVMTSLNVRNVHIARLASSGSRRMPAPFLLRNWGTCNSETEQRYEKHLIDDARLFGGKLSFGMALLFLGALDNHSVNYDVLYPLEESVWTLIDKDVQALSADRLNEAGDHLAKWQSTSEVVAEYLRDNIDKAELHLMHMMGGPTVASVM